MGVPLHLVVLFTIKAGSIAFVKSLTMAASVTFYEWISVLIMTFFAVPTCVYNQWCNVTWNKPQYHKNTSKKWAEPSYLYRRFIPHSRRLSDAQCRCFHQNWLEKLHSLHFIANWYKLTEHTYTFQIRHWHFNSARLSIGFESGRSKTWKDMGCGRDVVDAVWWVSRALCCC